MTNDRGRDLTEFMEDNFFILLNGRTPGDSPANFTYVGPKGNSVIDLVWCSSRATEVVDNFYVSPDFHLSDHLPVIAILLLDYCDLQNDTDKGENLKKLTWNSTKKRVCDKNDV